MTTSSALACGAAMKYATTMAAKAARITDLCSESCWHRTRHKPACRMRPITVSYSIQRLTAPNGTRYNGLGAGLPSGARMGNQRENSFYDRCSDRAVAWVIRIDES